MRMEEHDQLLGSVIALAVRLAPVTCRRSPHAVRRQGVRCAAPSETGLGFDIPDRDSGVPAAVVIVVLIWRRIWSREQKLVGVL